MTPLPFSYWSAAFKIFSHFAAYSYSSAVLDFSYYSVVLATVVQLYCSAALSCCSVVLSYCSEAFSHCSAALAIVLLVLALSHVYTIFSIFYMFCCL